MNRDNVLFVTIGLLAGFISGYVMHEVMAERQPQRRPASATTPAGSPPPGAAAPAAEGSAPAMEQVQQLRRRVEENPDDVQAVRALANLNYDIRNWTRAAELYSRALELVPDDVDLMTDLGVCYRNLRQAQQALEVFQRARGIAPEHWQSRYNEILVLAFDLADLEAAGTAMAQLQALQPDNPEVARLAGEIERRRGVG